MDFTETKTIKKPLEKVKRALTKIRKPVANVTGKANAAEANNNDVAKKTVKPTPMPTDLKETPEWSPLDGIGEFDKAFPKSRRAYEPKYLITGLLPAPENEVWDEGLEGYIVHEDTNCITPGHTSKTLQLWPGAKRKHTKRPETIAKMDEGKPILLATTKPPLPTMCTKASTFNGTTRTYTAKTIIDTTPAPDSNQPTKNSRSQFRNNPE